MLASIRPKPATLIRPQRPIELVLTIPEHTYSVGTERSWRRIFHVLVPNCRVGEVLSIESSFEATNDTGTNVEISGGLILTPQSTGTAGMELLDSVSNITDPVYGKVITPMNGENITPGEHHKIVDRDTDFVIPEGFSGDQYVAMVVYAAGGGTISNPRSILIEPYSSSISILRL